MSTGAQDAELAHKTARWILLVPLSVGCGLAVGLATRVVLELVLPKSLPAASLGAAALSAGVGAATLLSAAHSIAPFWKRGVVVAFAVALVFTNVVAALSPSWSLLWSLIRRQAHPEEQENLAESVGCLSVALVALVVSVRRARGRPTT